MSKTSRFFLGVNILGLAFIAGVRAYRFYESRVEQQQQEIQTPTLMFNNVPVQQVPPQQEEQIYKTWTGDPTANEFYLQDTPLPPDQQKAQARATVVSILDDYKDTPEIQSFYTDLRETTGQADMDLSILSGEKLPQLLKEYPQLQQVVNEHVKDPAFAQVVREIFNNPQFVESIKILQGAPQPQIPEQK